MKNPKWSREEIILALDLYFHPNRGTISKTNPRIIELSETLRALKLPTERPDTEKFRNANGCSLKLSNFLALDPQYSGEGMKSYSALDEAIFHEFANDIPKLCKAADEIRSTLL